MNKIRILFVCMGNICRSPTAEGVFKEMLLKQNVAWRFEVDSAGTHAYHVGDSPDFRSQKAAKERGVDLSTIRARKFIIGDFEDFDFILAMDEENYAILMDNCPDEYKSKIQYFLEYAPQLETKEVPDPYYGGKYGFERVLDMIEAASDGFLKSLKESGAVQ